MNNINVTLGERVGAHSKRWLQGYANVDYYKHVFITQRKYFDAWCGLPPHVTSYTKVVFMYLSTYLALIIIIGFAFMFSYIRGPSLYFFLEDPSYEYPSHQVQVSTPFATVLSIAIPIVGLIVYNLLLIRNIPDLHHCLLGILTSLICAAFFTGALWLFIGGYRPTLLFECDANQSKIDLLRAQKLKPWNDLVAFTTEDICNNNVHPQGFANTPGFPSGHASNAFAGWIFVFFYIGAKTNIWQSSLAHPWKWLFMIGFLIFPVWIASTRVVDHFHFVSQVLTGGFIGITCAIIGYGTNYCSFFGDDCFVPIYYHWRKAAILENERKRAQVFDKVSV